MNCLRNLTWSSALIAASVLCADADAAVLADFETVDKTTNVATGTLSGIAFSFEATVVRSQTFMASGITGAKLDGTSDRFDSPYFSPVIPATDYVSLGATSDFQFSFAAPVSDLTLHVSELAGNSLTFSSEFTLLSSDGDLTVNSANTITGKVGSSLDDANGSLFFQGTMTQLSWTSNANDANDGFFVQISAVPEPSALLLIGSGIAVVISRRTKRETLGRSRSKTVVHAPRKAVHGAGRQFAP